MHRRRWRDSPLLCDRCHACTALRRRGLRYLLAGHVCHRTGDNRRLVLLPLAVDSRSTAPESPSRRVGNHAQLVSAVSPPFHQCRWPGGGRRGGAAGLQRTACATSAESGKRLSRLELPTGVDPAARPGSSPGSKNWSRRIDRSNELLRKFTHRSSDRPVDSSAAGGLADDDGIHEGPRTVRDNRHRLAAVRIIVTE
jgi:hypothetical protein